MSHDFEYVRASACPNTVVTEATLDEWIYARMHWHVQKGTQGQPDPQLLRAQDLQTMERHAAWNRADAPGGGGAL